MIVVEAAFDPITQSELNSIKKLYRQSHAEDIYIQVKDEEAVLSVCDRELLVLDASAPFRHLHLIKGYRGSTIVLDECVLDEEKVRSGLFRLAADGTRKRIFANGWYFKETAHAMCTPHRYEHSIRTAETAASIAAAQGVDPFTAYKAGLLHDITKKMSRDDGEKILKIYRPEWLSLSDKIWHSYTAEVWIRQNMGFYDTDILHAISHHTIGDGCSKLDRILYIADKIEPGRGYDTSEQMALACRDLEAGVARVKKDADEYRKNKEIVNE